MEQFAINEKVIHCREGLSIISGTTVMCDRDYFVIHSTRGDGEAIYVPVASASNIIRKVLKKEEAEKLLGTLRGIAMDYNPNTKQRRDAYKRRLGTGDINDIAYLFVQGCLFEDNPDKVRLGPSDNEMLQTAKDSFLDEMALTFNVEREKIESFIRNKLK